MKQSNLKENIYYEIDMYENIPSLLYYGGSGYRYAFCHWGFLFDTPKVVNIVKEHIQSFTEPTDVILDFFFRLRKLLPHAP